MKILDYRPSKETAFLLHAVFFNFYCLLIGRTVLVVSGIKIDVQEATAWERRLVSLERLTNVIFFAIDLEPFGSVTRLDSTYSEDYVVSLLFAFVVFVTIHRGMFMDVSPRPETTWADKVLKVCRAIFFLIGSLLLILMVIRMGYALYEQLNPSRLILVDPAKIRAVPKN